MAKTCFCGCGTRVPFGRRRLANGLGAQIAKDVATFRGAAERGPQDEHAAELAELVVLGEPLRDTLREIIHGTINRSAYDKNAGRAWLRRAHTQRRRLAKQMVDEDYAGWDAHAQAELVYAGRRAPAVVIDVEDTGTTVGHDPRVRLRLRVEPPGEEPFELERKLLVSRIAVPRRGERVEVAYDPGDPERFTFRIEDLTDDLMRGER